MLKALNTEGTSMKPPTIFAAVLATIAMSGCATRAPVNYANSGANYYADKQDCAQQVARMQQSVSAMQASQPSTPTGMNCTTTGNQTNCNSTGGAQPNFLTAAAVCGRRTERAEFWPVSKC